MIVVDTNILYAAADQSDTYHGRCREWVESTDEVLLVPPTILAENCYLIDRGYGPAAEATFLDEVGIGDDYPYQLVDLTEADLRRMAELVRQYADRRLGGRDVSTIAVAEQIDIATIATVNRRDFDNVRPRRRPAFDIVPE